jgi:hypothetical protein
VIKTLLNYKTIKTKVEEFFKKIV